MTEKAPITRFGLIRHAPTVWNRQKRIQGWCDTPLSAESPRLARQWSRLLGQWQWQRILSSDLGRAVATAQLLNESWHLPLARESRLREMDWGAWTGQTLRQLRRENVALLNGMESKGWDFHPPGGEDRRSLWQRSCTALREAANRWPGQTILVVTHEGVIKCLIYGLLERLFLPCESPLIQRRYMHLLIHNKEHLMIDRINVLGLNDSFPQDPPGKQYSSSFQVRHNGIHP